LGEANGGEPRVAGRIMCELKDDIDFFKRPEGSFRIEEIDQRKYGKVSDCENDPSAIGDALECDRRDENNAIQC
jgi:hypothetical protein